MPPELVHILVERLSGSASPAEQRALLEQAGEMLIRHPRAGSDIVTALGSLPGEGASDDAQEALCLMLESALSAARMARDNGQALGSGFIDAVEAQVRQMAGDGVLTAKGRFMLARSWTRAEVAPPAALELTADDVEALVADDTSALPDDGDAAAMIDSLFGDLLAHAEGDVSELHATFAELLPAVPAEARQEIIRHLVSRAGEIHGRLGAAWLLDPLEAVRLAAAHGFSDRLVRGHLGTGETARLVVLRNWLPADAARTRVDAVIREAVRQGVSGGEAAPVWQVHQVLGSIPDGAGAQSIAIALRAGRRRATAMLLLKHGHGVRDAFIVSGQGAAEQRRLLATVAEETGAITVAPGFLEEALPLALGEALALGNPPAPGLVEVAEAAGLAALRPDSNPATVLLERLDADGRVAGLSAQALGKLVRASGSWIEAWPILESWFEDGDAVDGVLREASGGRAAQTALWQWLDGRREHWAGLLAKAARVLGSADDPRADSFVATAQALLAGHDLRKIPIMQHIHQSTITAWLYHGMQEADAGFDTPEAAADAEDGGIYDDVGLPSSPKPEKKGELARLLKGAALTPEWIDGYLAAVVLAPKPVVPNAWLSPVLETTAPALSECRLERFLDLLLLRYNGALALFRSADSASAGLEALPVSALHVWAGGFASGYRIFKSSWSAKSLDKEDRAILKQIEAAAKDPSAPLDIQVLAAWGVSRLGQGTG